jgi:predicted dehydrogenase
MAKRTDPIRLGIVGLGRAGWGMHRNELAPRAERFEIVAACDLEKSRRERMAEHADCRTYRTIEELAEDPDVELVDIATRSPEHVAHAKLALAAGKHVFLEKPIALSYREAKTLKTAAAKAAGSLYIRHNRRFEPAFQQIRRIMADGLLGEVYEIKLRRHNFQRRDDWQTIIECGGGQLLNWGPHIVDHALRLLESPVAEQWSDLKRIAAVGDAEDHVRIVLRGENDRVVDLEISGGAALREPEYIVFGTTGSLIARGGELQLRYLDPKAKLKPRRPKKKNPPLEGGFGGAEELPWVEETRPVQSPTGEEMPSIWDHLYAAIREGADFPITLEEALEVMETISRAKAGTPFDTKQKAKRG